MTTTRDKFNGSTMVTYRGTADEVAAVRADLLSKGYRVVAANLVKVSFGKTTHAIFEVA